MKKRLLIVDPGSQRFRGDILKHLVEHGYEVFVAGDERGKWTEKLALDFCDIASQIDPIKALYEFGKYHKVHGILTYSEVCVPLVAEVGQLLDLIHIDLSTAMTFREKFLMRQALANAGITRVQFFIAQTSQEAIEYVCRIGFPVVVKPVAGHSSIGVVKVYNEQQVKVAAERALQSTFKNHIPAVIVEEYLDGPEVSIECFVENGQPTVVAITDKRLSAAPFFGEISHTVPGALPPTAQYLLTSLATRALIALGLQNGIAHVEARLTSQGPKVIEIAARLGGDFIPQLVELATGIDLPVIAASLACGLPIEIGHIRAEAASIAFVIPAQEGVIQTITGFANTNANIVHAEFWASTGQEVYLPPKHYLTRLGYVITKATSPSQALQSAIEAIHSVELTIS